MRRFACLLLFAVTYLAACRELVPKSAPRLDSGEDLRALAEGQRQITCGENLKPVADYDSDQGWGYVERTSGCADADKRLQGIAVEHLSLTGVARIGVYKNRIPVGVWTLVSEKGDLLGRYTLDDRGNGDVVLRDIAGHTARGRLAAGERDGRWTIHDVDGRVAVTEEWSHGKFLHQTGMASWDPSMIDARDLCSVDGSAPKDDGCPD